MPRPVIFLFPGQSSRDAAMFARLDAAAPGAGTAAHGRSHSALGAAPGAQWATNAEVQVSVLESTFEYLRLARESGLEPVASAGLSLGEYAHLVEIGALDQMSARALVLARGRAYDGGPSGVMAAVHPLDATIVEQLAREISAAAGDPYAVTVSNYNSPTQCVVAGDPGAVAELLRRAEEEHFAGGQVIEQRIPMHTARFATVVERFRPALERAPWRTPHAEYWPNVDAAPLTAATPGEIIDRLARHVHEPVRWRQTIDAFLARHADPVFVEVGPLQVLTRMLSRRWIGSAQAFALDLMDDASAPAFAARLEEIHAAAA
jgi:[acyl-carrier-protein] S-malonyltransferase